jgi:hypothetical protein
MHGDTWRHHGRPVSPEHVRVSWEAVLRARQLSKFSALCGTVYAAWGVLPLQEEGHN